MTATLNYKLAIFLVLMFGLAHHTHILALKSLDCLSLILLIRKY